jgi:DNA-binding response OmpR family regulator
MKILLVEDDPFFQKFYTFKLRESGYEVVSALDGVQGVVAAKSEHPDLILLDLIMPNKDGFGVLTDLSADDALKHIPVLVFSTLSQKADVDKAMSLGARDYVNKSFFDYDKLLAKITDIINPGK